MEDKGSFYSAVITNRIGKGINVITGSSHSAIVCRLEETICEELSEENVLCHIRVYDNGDIEITSPTEMSEVKNVACEVAIDEFRRSDKYKLGHLDVRGW